MKLSQKIATVKSSKFKWGEKGYGQGAVNMLPYLLYFLIGGVLVASVVYLATRGNTVVAALVANLPILFLVSAALIYRDGGTANTVAYAKSMLTMLPVFIFYVVLTMWLLPRLGMPRALLPGLPIYLMPLVVKRVTRRRASKEEVTPSQLGSSQ